MTNTVATTIASIFLEHRVNNFCVPTNVLVGNGVQFTSKFFEAICTQLGIKAATITKYHLQANGQVERFKLTIKSRL